MADPKTLGSALLILFGVIELVMRQGAVAKSFSTGGDDRGSTRLMLVVWIPAVAALFTAGVGPKLALWIQWLGIAMGSAGILLRIIAFRTLGKYYTRTLVTVTGQSVVQRGPYRYVRHPGYLSTLLIWVGAATGFGSLLPPLLEFVLLFPVYAYRIGIEERMLLKNLGGEYSSYRTRSWRLVPFVF
jgi:protein-S-isoprenylcysteine O-methyltransferase Ste14